MFGRRKKAKAAAAAAAAATTSAPGSSEAPELATPIPHVNHRARADTRSPDRRPGSFAQGLVRRSSNPKSLSLSGSTSSVSSGPSGTGSGAAEGSPESSYGSLNGATAWKASQRQSKAMSSNWLPPALADPSSGSSTTTGSPTPSSSTHATDGSRSSSSSTTSTSTPSPRSQFRSSTTMPDVCPPPPLVKEGSSSSVVAASPKVGGKKGTKAPEVLEHFQLGQSLGKGGAGRVYLALDTRTGDFVALKRLDVSDIAPSKLNDILGESHILERLDHDNILRFRGVIRAADTVNFVLDYAENGSLTGLLDKFGPLPESLAAIYIRQVLKGLAYLHDQGIIHRDIKGSNILLTKDGTCKLADFGVAAQMQEMAELRYTVVGTPYWMAPESILITGHHTASDIWSLGCTVVELITGTPPYYGMEPMAALFRIVEDESPPLAFDKSDTLSDFLTQCFAKDPTDRATAKSLLEHPWIAGSQPTNSEQKVSYKEAMHTLRAANKSRSMRPSAMSAFEPISEAEPAPAAHSLLGDKDDDLAALSTDMDLLGGARLAAGGSLRGARPQSAPVHSLGPATLRRKRASLRQLATLFKDNPMKKAVIDAELSELGVLLEESDDPSEAPSVRSEDTWTYEDERASRSKSYYDSDDEDDDDSSSSTGSSDSHADADGEDNGLESPRWSVTAAPRSARGNSLSQTSTSTSSLAMTLDSQLERLQNQVTRLSRSSSSVSGRFGNNTNTIGSATNTMGSVSRNRSQRSVSQSPAASGAAASTPLSASSMAAESELSSSSVGSSPESRAMAAELTELRSEVAALRAALKESAGQAGPRGGVEGSLTSRVAMAGLVLLVVIVAAAVGASSDLAKTQ